MGNSSSKKKAEEVVRFRHTMEYTPIGKGTKWDRFCHSEDRLHPGRRCYIFGTEMLENHSFQLPAWSTNPRWTILDLSALFVVCDCLKPTYCLFNSCSIIFKEAHFAYGVWDYVEGTTKYFIGIVSDPDNGVRMHGLMVWTKNAKSGKYDLQLLEGVYEITSNGVKTTIRSEDRLICMDRKNRLAYALPSSGSNEQIWSEGLQLKGYRYVNYVDEEKKTKLLTCAHFGAWKHVSGFSTEGVGFLFSSLHTMLIFRGLKAQEFKAIEAGKPFKFEAEAFQVDLRLNHCCVQYLTIQATWEVTAPFEFAIVSDCKASVTFPDGTQLEDLGRVLTDPKTGLGNYHCRTVVRLRQQKDKEPSAPKALPTALPKVI